MVKNNITQSITCRRKNEINREMKNVKKHQIEDTVTDRK